MEKMKISFTLNGKPCQVEVKPHQRLLDMLRDDLRLTGTKEGCGIGECGACTVILNGRAVNSCCVLAEQAHGCTVETIEGIGSAGHPHPLQQAFVDAGAIQCGFCTPGMILSAKALLDRNPDPSEEDIRLAMSGNLCRCTGYTKIIDAVALAAQRMAKE